MTADVTAILGQTDLLRSVSASDLEAGQLTAAASAS